MRTKDDLFRPLPIPIFRSCATLPGFTLIELVVAIAILALVAVLGWRGLDGIVRARVALTTQMEQTGAMQLTFAQLQSDTAQLAPANLMSNRPTLLAIQNRLLMVRLVVVEQQPLLVQIVEYRLRNGLLTREESPATRDLKRLDAMWEATINDAGNGGSQAVLLQSNISRFAMQVWGSDGQGWQSAEVATSSLQGAISGINRWTGLQVELQQQGGAGVGNMVKTFLLGTT